MMLVLSVSGVSAHAQDVKPKPPMYTYVANWQVARATGQTWRK